MKKGVIALPTIILIGGIILEIVLTLSLVSYLLLQSGAGSKFAAEALVYAQSGVDDSVIKIIRNNNLGNGSGYKYTLNIDPIRQTKVFVCKDYDFVSDFQTAENICDVYQSTTGKTNIISLGKSFNKYRLLKAVVNINSNNNEVKIESVQEIPL